MKKTVRHLIFWVILICLSHLCRADTSMPSKLIKISFNEGRSIEFKEKFSGRDGASAIVFLDKSGKVLDQEPIHLSDPTEESLEVGKSSGLDYLISKQRECSDCSEFQIFLITDSQLERVYSDKGNFSSGYPTIEPDGHIAVNTRYEPNWYFVLNGKQARYDSEQSRRSFGLTGNAVLDLASLRTRVQTHKDEESIRGYGHLMDIYGKDVAQQIIQDLSKNGFMWSGYELARAYLLVGQYEKAKDTLIHETNNPWHPSDRYYGDMEKMAYRDGMSELAGYCELNGDLLGARKALLELQAADTSNHGLSEGLAELEERISAASLK